MNIQKTNKLPGAYLGLVFYALFIVFILICKPLIWWVPLVSMLITEVLVRFLVHLSVQDGIRNLLIKPIENGINTLFEEYTATQNLRTTYLIRQVMKLYVGRWIIFSAIANILSLPHSACIPYFPLQSFEQFAISHSSVHDYPLAAILYMIEYLFYIVFALVADVVILLGNSLIIALIPIGIHRYLYGKLQNIYPLPPPFKRKVYRILEKIEIYGVTNLSSREKMAYKVYLVTYNVYLKKQAAKGFSQEK
jgi:hypothetical protein